MTLLLTRALVLLSVLCADLHAAPGKVFVYGQRGRMGGEFTRLAAQAGLEITDRLGEAGVVVVSQGRQQARETIQGLQLKDGVTVIDLSGALKEDFNSCVYALLAPDGRLFQNGAKPCEGARFGNPGCMAGGVIVGLTKAFERAGLSLSDVAGPIHVTAVGGAAVAPRDQDGQMRSGRRLGSAHPHVPEIEWALPTVRVGAFVPVISYAQERGLLITVSGMLKRSPGNLPENEGGALDVAEVIGTPEVHTRLNLEERGGTTVFTVTIALDNLTFPVENAVRVIQALEPPQVVDPSAVVAPPPLADPFAPAETARPLRILITAGGTKEPIDDVRYLTNFSSGALGRGFAAAAAAKGHRVVVLAPKEFPRLTGGLPPGVEHRPFTSTADLFQKIKDAAGESAWDIVIHSAAVSDYTPRAVADGKISSSREELSIHLVKTPKLIRSFRGLFGDEAFLVGFKLLSGVPAEERQRIALRQIQDCRTDLCVENDLSEISREAHRARVVTPEGLAIPVPVGDKGFVAERILNYVIRRVRR